MEIAESVAAYERWLRDELGQEVVGDGLKRKRKAMRESPFAFLRATFFRWAETVHDMAPELMNAPPVLAVGDIHLENFGTWRDADGRLVFGVNDVDEAADMPYALDLLRLLASALLAIGPQAGAEELAASLLRGYREGLARPAPLILDRGRRRLRALMVVPEVERTDFWDTLAKKRKRFEASKDRPVLWPRYRRALAAALPPGAGEPRFWHRNAGLGSLGRPRWVAEARWCGDVVVREAKGLVPSAWIRRPGSGCRANRCLEIATGRFRAPDPWYRVLDGVVVRRLSPNNRKITVEGEDGARDGASERKKARERLENGITLTALRQADLLRPMGQDLAAIHRGTPDVKDAITADLARRRDGWLAAAAVRAAAAVEAEFKAWT